MAISLNEPGTTRTPVVKRTAIGQTFTGCLIRTERRDVMKTEDGVQKPVFKPNGKPKQELVVTCLTLPGTTSPAGIGDEVGVPAVGDTVRLILRGKAYGDWIEATKGGVFVGDVVSQTTDTAQAYDAAGAPKGAAMSTQAEIDALPRSTSVGIYGPLTVRRPAGDELSKWVPLAEAAYHEATRVAVEPTGDLGPDDLI